MVKNLPATQTLGSIPVSGRSLGEEKGSPLSILAFDFMYHIKLWNILKDMGIPDHIICLLRNMYIRDKKQQVELDVEQ